jgi:hypothetical protein
VRLFFATGLVAVSALVFSRPALAQGDPATMDYQDPAETPRKPAAATDGEISNAAGTSRVESTRRLWYGLPLIVADAGAFALASGSLGLLGRGRDAVLCQARRS